MSKGDTHIGYIGLVYIVSFGTSLEIFISKPVQLQQYPNQIYYW